MPEFDEFRAFESEVKQTLIEGMASISPRSGLVDELIRAARDGEQDGGSARAGAPGPRHRVPWRWVGPLLAAAAVIVAALGVGLIVLPHSTQVPAGHPSEPLINARPNPRTSPPAPSSASSAPAGGGSAASGGTSAPDDPHTYALSLSFPVAGGSPIGVTFTVPDGWRLAGTQPTDSPDTRCVVEAGDFDGDAESCMLVVSVGVPGHAISPDDVTLAADQPQCSDWSTTSESEPALQGRPTEYRAFLNHCTGTASEQWTIMSDPQIVFWHPIIGSSSSALLSELMFTATLPPVRSTARQFDTGKVMGIYHAADGYHITLDRVVVNADDTITNVNPTTYDYRLAPGLDVTAVAAWLRSATKPSAGGSPYSGPLVQVTSASGAPGTYVLGPAVPPAASGG